MDRSKHFSRGIRQNGEGRMRFLVILLSLSFSSLAGEYAVLASGSRLRVDRHEIAGDKVRLYNGDGYTELATVAVRSFEPDDHTPAIPAAETEPEGPVAPAASEPVTLTPVELADAAADRYALPHWLVREVMHVESGFQAQ